MLPLSDEQIEAATLWDGNSDISAIIGRLRDMSDGAESEDEVRAVTRRIASLSRQFRIRTGVGLPASPLIQAVELDPNYRVLPHLELISNEIVEAVRMVERGKNQQLAFSMPPRSGKSELISKRSPLWMLRRHPEWKIVQASYSSLLVGDFAKWIRTTIEDNPQLGIALARDGGKASMWNTIEGGGIYTTSVRGALTGRGARVVFIDDPIKDFIEAHSLTMRQNVWDWWLSVVQTRLEPPYLIVAVQCMTGDTAVLMADGTEKPLRNVRPGDLIATYEDGQVSSSKVLNWANQGPDEVFAVRMTSGRVVRGNARHPFRVIDEEGNASWVRLSDLKPGMQVRSVESTTAASPGLRAASVATTTPTSASTDGTTPVPSGASGEALAAAKTDATSPSAPRDSASPTTTEPVGRLAMAAPLSPLAVPHTSVIDTGFRSTSSLPWSKSKKDVALSVGGTRMRPNYPDTGARPSASITTTTPDESADFSATTATSPSDDSTQSSSLFVLSSTYGLATDTIESIVTAGTEDVFDIEVERTHNFIADGLEVSNTRWHEDDFIGRLLSNDYEGDPRTWKEIRLPAIAEEADAIDRQPGDPLWSPLLQESRGEALDRWDDVKRAVGGYTWSALYQQRPAPARGAIFDTGWWRYWTCEPSRATEDGRIIFIDPDEFHAGQWVDSWDTSFKGSTSSSGGASDFVVGQRWVRMGANRYLISQLRGRWSFTQTIEKMQMWARQDDHFASPYGAFVHDRLIEDKANGSAIIDTLKERISGLKPVNPSVGKEARARAVTPEIESGNVFLPHPADDGNEWVQDLLSELRNFPHDAADDQVDSMTQALAYLRYSGTGGISVPGMGRPALRDGQTWQAPRDLARASLRSMSQVRGRR